MIRITQERLWELIYQDKKIKAELERQLEEEQKKRDKCFKAMQQQIEVLNFVQKKQHKVEKSIRETYDMEDKLNGKISSLEIHKMFVERRIRKIQKQLAKGNLTEKELAKLTSDLSCAEEEIKSIERDQDYLRNEIRDCIGKRVTQQTNYRDYQEKVDEENSRLTTAKQNVVEWDLTLETKTNRFYNETYNALNEDFKLMQNLVVRNLESDKRLTKDEAKEKANAVILGTEEIAIDPPGKTRRLTKEEKEKYRNVD